MRGTTQLRGAVTPLLLALVATLAGVGPGQATPLPPPPGGAWSPIIRTSADGQLILVIAVSPNNDAVAVTSTDSGRHWTTPVSVTAGTSPDPYNGGVYGDSELLTDPDLRRVALFERQSDGSILLHRSRDGGRTWQAPRSVMRADRDAGTMSVLHSPNLTTLTLRRLASSIDDSSGQVATSKDFGRTWRRHTGPFLGSGESPGSSPDGRHLATVFSPDFSGATVTVGVSHDTGGSWTTTQVTASPGNEIHPGIAAISDDGRRVTVIVKRDFFATASTLWHERLDVLTSSDSGAHFSDPVVLSTGSSVIQLAITMSADGAQQQFVLAGGTREPLRGFASTDGGAHWASPTVFVRPTYVTALVGDVGSRLVLVGSDAATSSTDGGLSWSAPVDLPDSSSTSVLAAGDVRVIARVWGVFRSLYEIDPHLDLSTDGGSSWAAVPFPPRGTNSPGTLSLTDDGAAMLSAWSVGDRLLFSTLAPSAAAWSSPVRLFRQAPVTRLTVRARPHGRTVRAGAKTRVIRGVTTTGTARINASCRTKRGRVPAGRKATICGIRVHRSQLTLRVRPRCSVMAVTVRIRSRGTQTATATWRRTWKVRACRR